MRWSVYVWVSLTLFIFFLFLAASEQDTDPVHGSWARSQCPTIVLTLQWVAEPFHTGIGHGVSHSFLLHAVLTLWKICNRAKIQRASNGGDTWDFGWKAKGSPNLFVSGAGPPKLLKSLSPLGGLCPVRLCAIPNLTALAKEFQLPGDANVPIVPFALQVFAYALFMPWLLRCFLLEARHSSTIRLFASETSPWFQANSFISSFSFPPNNVKLGLKKFAIFGGKSFERGIPGCKERSVPWRGKHDFKLLAQRSYAVDAASLSDPEELYEICAVCWRSCCVESNRCNTRLYHEIWTDTGESMPRQCTAMKDLNKPASQWDCVCGERFLTLMINDVSLGPAN